MKSVIGFQGGAKPLVLRRSPLAGSFSTVTALCRNFMCVVQDVLPATNILNKQFLVKAPLPFKELSILNVLIGATQGMGMSLNAMSLLKNSVAGLQQYKKANNALASLDRISVRGETSGDIEHTILRHGLKNDAVQGMRKLLMSIADGVIACTFMFLMANSFHVNPASHPRPLFRSIAFMEIALLFYIRWMWMGAMSKVKQSAKYTDLQKLLGHSKVSNRELLDLAFDAGFGDDLMAAYKLINPQFTPSYQSADNSVEGLRKDLKEISLSFDESSSVKFASASTLAFDLATESKRQFVDAMISLVLLGLNALAGFGYLMCVMAFFFPNAYNPVANLGLNGLARSIMLNLSPSAALFYGNLLGDSAWTLEPMIALLKPKLMDIFAPQPEESKAKKMD